MIRGFVQQDSVSPQVSVFTPRLCITFLLGIVLATVSHCAVAADGVPKAVPVDGKAFPAEFVGVDEKWLTLRSGKEERRLAAEDLVTWGAPVEPKSRGRLPERFPPAELLLVDEGLLVVDIKESKSDRFIAESSSLGDIEVPFERVRGALFRPPINRQRRDLFANRLTDEATKTDRLILENGDVVTGRILRFAAAEAGAKNVPAFFVEIKVGETPLKIDADRVVAAAFNPESLETPPRRGQRAVVGLADGSRLMVQSLRTTDKEVELRLAPGTTWKATRDQLVFLQPLLDKLTYVSDLIVPQSLDDSGDPKGTLVGRPPREKSARYKFVPYLTATWPLCADRNVRGTHVRSSGRLYLKGLGMHSGGMLTLILPHKCRRFDAELALDDEVGQRGSVTFNVKVVGVKDGKSTILREFTSEVIRGGAAPVPASVDLTDAAGIVLTVLFAERGDELDHANWLNARLVR
jgi:hypothetical protein